MEPPLCCLFLYHDPQLALRVRLQVPNAIMELYRIKSAKWTQTNFPLPFSSTSALVECQQHPATPGTIRMLLMHIYTLCTAGWVDIVNTSSFIPVFACTDKTSECERETGPHVRPLSLAEWRCASRPQAGEHPPGWRSECKGKPSYQRQSGPDVRLFGLLYWY